MFIMTLHSIQLPTTLHVDCSTILHWMATLFEWALSNFTSCGEWSVGFDTIIDSVLGNGDDSIISHVIAFSDIEREYIWILFIS